jgi:hypothetical protein
MKSTQPLARAAGRALQFVTRQAVLLLAGLGLVYSLLLFTLNSSLSTRIIDEAFNQSFKGSINWQRLNFGPLPWTIEIAGLDIRDGNGDSVIVADGVSIGRIDLPQLSMGNIHLQDVVLINSKVSLRRVALMDNGTQTSESERPLNIVQVFELKKPKPKEVSTTEMSIKVKEITLSNGLFELIDDGIEIRTGVINSQGVSFGLLVQPEDSEMNIRVPRLTASKLAVGVGLSIDEKRPLNWQLSQLMLNSLNWHGDEFELHELSGLLLDDAITVNDLHLELMPLGGPTIGLRAELDTQQIEKHLAQFGIDKTKGPLNVKVLGHGQVSSFTGTLAAATPGLIAQGIVLGASAVNVSIAKSSFIKILPSTVALWNGGTGFTGDLDLLTGNGHLELSAQKIQLQSIPGLEQPVRYHLTEGTISADQRLRFENLFEDSRLIETEGEVTIERQHPAFPLLKSTAIKLKADYLSQRVGISRFEVQSPNERINLTGWFNHERGTFSAKGSVSVFEVSALMALWQVPVNGNVGLDFDASGNIDDPTISVLMGDTRLSYQTVKDVEISGSAKLSQKVVSLSNLKLVTQSAGVAILGTVDLTPKFPSLELSLITENLELKLLGLAEGMSGKASLEVDLTGSTQSPSAKLRGKVRDFCFRPQVDSQIVCIDEIQTRSQVSKDLFSIGTFSLRDAEWGMVEAHGDGSITKQSFNGTLDLVDFPLSLLDAFISEPLGIKGRVDADLSVGGDLQNPIAGGKLEVQGFAYDQYSLGDLTILLVGNERSSTVQVLGLDGQRLILKVPLTSEQEPTAKLLLRSFKPQDWLPQLAEQPIKATISGEANATFKDLSFALTQANVSLKTVTVDYTLKSMGIQVSHVKPIEVRWKDGDVAIDSMSLNLATQNFADGSSAEMIRTLQLNIGGALPSSNTFDLKFEGDLLIPGIKPFVKGTFSQTQGAGRLSGKLTGPLSAPRPELNLVIDSLSLTPRSGVVGTLLELQDPLGIELRPTSEDAEAGTWLINRISDGTNRPVRILRDESVFKLDEIQLEFEQFVPRKVRVNGRVLDLAVRIPGVMTATINAPELVVEWSKPFQGNLSAKPKLLVGGAIEVQRGVFVQDVTGVNQINEDVRNRLIGRSAIKRVSIAERFPILKRLFLDLSVTGDGDFFVRNRVTVLSLDMEIKIAFDQIRGYLYPAAGDSPDEQLSLVGDVTILPDSKLIYARRDFDVNRGIIDFGRGQFMDAELEASRTFTLRSNRSSAGTSTQFDRGSGDVRLEEVNLTARIQQSSLQSAPKISMNLSSNSGASKFDVAMLVLTGSYPEDASGAASAQPAAEVLLAPLLSLVERPLEDTLNIDLSLTPATAGSLFIDIDKMLSRRLRLYSRVFVGDGDETNPQKFGLEYQINNTVLGEFTSEKTGNYLSTTGRLRLKLEID